MSLINDALQDLEARKPSRESSPGCAPVNVEMESSPSRARTQRNARSGVNLAVVGAVLGAAFSVGLLWWSPWQAINVHRHAEQANTSYQSDLLDQTPEKKTSLNSGEQSKSQAVAAALSVSGGVAETAVVVEKLEPEVSQGPRLAMTPPTQALATASASDSAMQAPHTSSQIKMTNEPSQENIAEFLVKAASAFERNQLSVPAHNNALYFIERVLAEDPSQPTALALLSRVQDSYRTQITAAIARGDVAHASTLLSRHEAFQLRATSFAQEFAEIAMLKAAQQELAVEKTASAPLHSVQVQKDELESTVSSHGKSASWVEVSAASLDRKQVDIAQSSVGTVRQAAALQQLETFVLANKNALLSTLFLADYYADTKNNSALLALLTQLPNDHKALNYIRGKHLALSQDVEGAIAALTSQAADPRIAREVQTYLGGLYHSTQQYTHARDVYQALLRVEPNDSKVLLGFALANDALGEVQHSLSAYRELLRLGHRNQTVLAFVEQRVQTLTQSQKLEAALW